MSFLIASPLKKLPAWSQDLLRCTAQRMRKEKRGIPQWGSGKALQCRGHGFNPWSGSCVPALPKPISVCSGVCVPRREGLRRTTKRSRTAQLRHKTAKQTDIQRETKPRGWREGGALSFRDQVPDKKSALKKLETENPRGLGGSNTVLGLKKVLGLEIFDSLQSSSRVKGNQRKERKGGPWNVCPFSRI